MKKIIFLPILFLLVACGPSGEEEQHTNETVKDTFFECRDAVIVVEHDKSMVTVINKNSGEHKHLFLEKDLRETKGSLEKYYNVYVDERAMHNNFLPPTISPPGYSYEYDSMVYDLRVDEIGWLRVYFKGKTKPVYYRNAKCEQ
tara:strand:+ start:39 stop:470 length:432 start_codon:yes stop_codon:yes gene_type:complete